jgi:hypothetical protein
MRLTHNTLSENVRMLTSELLNRHLAAAIDLHGQLKQATGTSGDQPSSPSTNCSTRSPKRRRPILTCSPSAPQALALSRKARFRSRPSAPSLSRIPCESPAKTNTCSRSPRRLPRSGNRPAKRSDNLRRSATLIRPIYSPRYRAASTISSGLSNRMRHRYERNVRLCKGPAGQSRRFHENCDSADSGQ